MSDTESEFSICQELNPPTPPPLPDDSLVREPDKTVPLGFDPGRSRDPSPTQSGSGQMNFADEESDEGVHNNSNDAGSDDTLVRDAPFATNQESFVSSSSGPYDNQRSLSTGLHSPVPLQGAPGSIPFFPYYTPVIGPPSDEEEDDAKQEDDAKKEDDYKEEVQTKGRNAVSAGVPQPNIPNGHYKDSRRYTKRIKIEDTVEVPVEDNEKPQTQQQREKLTFRRSGDRKRIDYVLVYEDTEDEDKILKRETYEANLQEEGLKLEFHDKSNSVDEKSNFVLVHATWEALLTGAELMNMQKKLKMPKNIQSELQDCCDCCCNLLSVGEPIIQEEDDYFTSGFSREMINTFDIDMRHKEEFFTNAERSLIVKEILDRTLYTGPGLTTKIGIPKLIRNGTYKAAYPLHEGPHKPIDYTDQDPWEGQDKDRARLYEAWARPGRWLCYQPLDLIRKYFGEKIAIYFAWLGFYTAMLIPAAIVGMAAFAYGLVTLWDYQPVKDVCNAAGVGGSVMCPLCDKRCSYWKLEESCLYSQLTYLFDNWATVAFSAFMSLWATIFLEFWKRKQKELEYDWDVSNFEFEERVRPEFEMKVHHTKLNPITLADEPFVPWYENIPRQCVSLGVIIFFIALVIAAIFSVILYRIIVIAVLYTVNPNETIAKLTTSITASVINLLLIIILNTLYRRVAHFLTELERPRTDTEFEDSFTFKMFLFQFVNFYGSIFYIAFFKGRFSEVPGLKRNYLFGTYRQDQCDPSGCLVDLFIQLSIVMVGKQMINNGKELLMPVMVAFCRVRDNRKRETKENLYMRWEQDNDLPPADALGLFEEYLEMVIQYGFVTIFVAAFPLGPLFALLNNVIEIRLDAYKFCKAWRRAPATKAQDIGVWYGILQSITFIAVLSNAFIIGWTSDFIPKAYYLFVTSPNQTLDGYVDSSLSYFATHDFHNDTRPDDGKLGDYGQVDYCRYKGYLDDPRKPLSSIKYDYSKQYWHILATRLAFVIVFEHTIFLLSWLLAVLITDTPARIKRLCLYERDLNKRMKFDAAFNNKKLKSLSSDLLNRMDKSTRHERQNDAY